MTRASSIWISRQKNYHCRPGNREARKEGSQIACGGHVQLLQKEWSTGCGRHHTVLVPRLITHLQCDNLMSQNLRKHLDSLRGNRNWNMIAHRISQRNVKCNSHTFFPCCSLWTLQLFIMIEIKIKRKMMKASSWRSPLLLRNVILLLLKNMRGKEWVLRSLSLPASCYSSNARALCNGNKGKPLLEARLWILHGWIYPSDNEKHFRISWWHNENVFMEKLMGGGQHWREKNCFFFFLQWIIHSNVIWGPLGNIPLSAQQMIHFMAETSYRDPPTCTWKVSGSLKNGSIYRYIWMTEEVRYILRDAIAPWVFQMGTYDIGYWMLQWRLPKLNLPMTHFYLLCQSESQQKTRWPTQCSRVNKKVIYNLSDRAKRKQQV